ncbi:MAG: DNA adenine methylase [Steroidobacteraceae bacterium]|nr:DNA adenine methylase [Steroidobacteraceae bacterium]
MINLIPPHRVYIETHLGGGAVMRNKRAAHENIGIDVDSSVIDTWRRAELGSLTLLHARAEDCLASYNFTGDELVYVDPPYHPATRRRARVYRHDYTVRDHEVLASLLAKLPCKVILSGYDNPVYSSVLADWHVHTFRAKTHTDVREETLWFNFERPSILHDARHLGEDFRQRLTIRRRMRRLQDRIGRMDPIERAAFAEWLYQTYPLVKSEASS